MRLGAAVATLLLLCASADIAMAQDVTRARLLASPSAQDFADAFPVVAFVRGVGGRAVLTCTVAVNGDSECAAVEEDPAGLGFATAAEALARDWRFVPRTERGAPVASVARVPVIFDRPEPQALPIEVAVSVRATPGAVASAYADTSAFDAFACRWATGTHCWTLRAGGGQDELHARYYPQAARAANANGRALIACVIRSDSRPECAVEQEAPAGLGFGASALQLVADIVAAGGDRFAPGRAFRVPVDFELNAPGERRDTSLWERRPTADDFARYYPPRAVQPGVDGDVLLLCTIRADRGLDCEIAEERPEDFGFGAAAQRIAAGFLLRDAALGQPGLAVGDRIRMPIRFRIR